MENQTVNAKNVTLRYLLTAGLTLTIASITRPTPADEVTEWNQNMLAAASVTSETLPGVARYFDSFSQAADELDDARVFGGIHFRNSCKVGHAQAGQVAEYILAHSLQRLHGKGDRLKKAGGK